MFGLPWSNNDETDGYFESFDPLERETISVSLVRPNTQSEISIDQVEVYEIQLSRFGPHYPFYTPYDFDSWQKFVWEFFPGWEISVTFETP